MKIILIAAVIALIIAVDRWMTWKVGVHACLLYLAEKNLPMPSDQELAISREKVIARMVNDFFGKKTKS